MSIETKTADDTAAPRSLAALVAIYTAAIFLSAALLFAVQPMFTKIVLPRFGGSPSVWAVAMVFFQGILLLGYAYADALTRFAGRRLALPIHLAVMIGGAMFLPLSIAQGWGMPPPGREELFLLGLFAASIGFPFFALSANGPLLQAWFARSGHPDAQNPYFLYAASNIGSLLALFAYPFIAEPLSNLSSQVQLWRYGYYLLIALIAVCGALVFTRNAEGELQTSAAEVAPDVRRMLRWVALAFVPSALMVAVTTHVTTDVAAAPFLWVLPLSLYLITFILVFSERTWIPQRYLLAAQPVLMVLVVLMLALDFRTWLTIDVALHLLFFFVTAMICHGQISATRPAAAYLTRFYFCMSLGGVLGGIFSGLLAPNIFSWIAEYPILVVLAALARSDFVLPARREGLIVLALAALVAVAMLPGLQQGFAVVPPYNWIVWGCALALAAVALLFRGAPLRIALAIAAVFIVTRVYPPNVRQLETVRSFFGVHKIEVTPDGRFRTLRHGMELHGAQRLTSDDGKPVAGTSRAELSTYYHRESPIAEVIKAVQEKKGGPASVAVVGLGAGIIACLTRPEDRLDYYEIDADIIRIANDPKRFSFIHDCKPGVKITLGDARLTLAANTEVRYDLIVIDAFSSDSIPVHLLTREAMKIYLSRLNPGGVILTHISNNHLDLIDVVAATAASEGLVARLNDEDVIPGLDPMIKFSTVMILARSNDDFGTLTDWDLQKPEPGQAPWSDDYSNLLGPLVKKLLEGDD